MGAAIWGDSPVQRHSGVCVSVHVCVRVHVWVCVNMCIHICALHLWVHMCMYVCVSVHVCACVYVHVCVFGGQGGQWQEGATVLDNKTKKFRERHYIVERANRFSFKRLYGILKSF